MLYLIHISRFVVAFIFFYSFVMKLRDFATFERTIKNFELLPQALHRPAAFTFMMSEGLIIITSVLGSNWLYISFGLAIPLLLLFIYALYSALKRKIKTSCNCFGMNEEKISLYDIWRNIGITLIAMFGFLALLFNNSIPSLLELFLCAMISLVLSLLLLSLRELMEFISL